MTSLTGPRADGGASELRIKRYRDVGSSSPSLLAVPFFFLRASMRDPRRAQRPRSRGPAHRGADPVRVEPRSRASVSNLWGDYVYLVDVKADNERLAYENARLRERVRRLEQNEVENRRLRRLLGLRETIPRRSR